MRSTGNDSAATASDADDHFSGLSEEERDLIVRYMVMRALAQLGLGAEPPRIEAQWGDDSSSTRVYRNG